MKMLDESDIVFNPEDGLTHRVMYAGSFVAFPCGTMRLRIIEKKFLRKDPITCMCCASGRE